MSDQPVFLGIDLGTSGVRACLIDAQGKELATARTPLPTPLTDSTGKAEQDPADWWRATLETVDQLPAEHLRNLRALSVDGTSGTLLLCDRDGEPLGPAMMYNDRRATKEAARLEPIAPPDAAVHSPTSALAKLMFLLARGSTGGVRHALHQADWIAFLLGAPPGVSDENNALKLGYDPMQRSWPEWLEDTEVPLRLFPHVAPVGEVIGELAPALRDRWGCAHPVHIRAGTTDSNAATLATGIREIGEAATALGSTLVLKILSDRPVFSAEYGIYSHRLGDRWLAGGASNSGGAVLRQFFDDQQLIGLSERIDPHTDSGLDYYPLPSPGERFPVNDPTLPPRVAPRPADNARFLQGLLEGIARIERAGYQRLHALGAPWPTRIVSTGGGARNPTWRAIRERLLGVPVEIATHTEAAYGSA
ncbi:MAG: carbohydrate kinase, partial [Gammaproteobacteria bacterium]